MPLSLTTPGVYVQELPSGTRTVTGVSTSLTAFVGPARRGPVNVPTRIFSFADFERQFGGLWTESTMSQSVRQYFGSGGGEALIVRVANADVGSGDEATSAEVGLSVASGRMVLQATAEAAALPGFDHLSLTVQNIAGDTFDLVVAAEDAANAVLNDGANDFSYTVGGLDISVADSMAAALAGESTGPANPDITLVELVGSQISEIPDAVEVTTSREGGLHLAAISASSGNDVDLVSANPGSWGNSLRASVSVIDAPDGAFHLTLREVDDAGNVVADEVFHNVSLVANSPRALDQVLELESALARVAGAMPAGAAATTDALVPFTNGADGTQPRVLEDVTGNSADRSGIYALLAADIFNLLCIPLASWETGVPAHVALWTEAAVLCEQRRAFLLIDPPNEWNAAADFNAVAGASSTFSPRSPNAALFYPQVRAPDPLSEGRLGNFPPCGFVAGVMARTDGSRGIWKAAAGTEAGLRGVPELRTKLTDAQQGVLNPLGINCLRTFPVFGSVVWGSRTLEGADALASQWKHIPVRRLALYMEESLFRGTRWAVFEPNDEPLWAQIRLSIGSFLQGLFRQGAFAGRSAREAYFVKCDRETTTQADIDRGIVNVIIGFAPLKPAEFVVIKLQQIAARPEA